jgi:hypothetical protein
MCLLCNMAGHLQIRCLKVWPLNSKDEARYTHKM